MIKINVMYPYTEARASTTPTTAIAHAMVKPAGQCLRLLHRRKRPGRQSASPAYVAMCASSVIRPKATRRHAGARRRDPGHLANYTTSRR